MASACQVHKAVLHHLQTQGTCTFDELTRCLRSFTFNQVFLAIDQLSRDGQILLMRHAKSGYVISRAHSFE